MPTWPLPSELECLFKTLEIRSANGFDFPVDLFSLKINLRKSRLYQRLLSGKEPLLYPPPTSFSYPWYELIEDGYGFPAEVLTPPKQIFKSNDGKDCLSIDNCLWEISEKISDEEYIASYISGSKYKYRHVSKTKWRVYVHSCELGKTNFSPYQWKIEIIEED